MQPITVNKAINAFVLFIALSGIFTPSGVRAQVFATRAAHAILIDMTSGTILFEKKAEERMPPASMAKIMTLAVVFQALKDNKLSLDDTFTISENAWRKGGANSGGSTMFAELNSAVTIENLINGIAIQSGNDASIAVAEGLAGSEPAFAKMMNALAEKIGMAHSHFSNATGLPDEAQYTTAKDLAILARYVIEEFPDLYAVFGKPEFTWNKIRQFNRNPVLKADIGGDGIKTGYTKESGYGVVGSAFQEGRRLVLVINGLESRQARAEEAKRLLEWGFRSFEVVRLFEKGKVIGQASVYGGQVKRVDVVAQRPVVLVLPKGEIGRISARVHYQGPLKAPVSSGERIGQLNVKIDGKTAINIDVFTNEDVAIGTLQQRAIDAIYELTIGWLGTLKPSG